MELLQILHDFVATEARRAGATVSPLGTHNPQKLPPAGARPEASHSPRGFVVGLHPVLFADLGADSDKARAAWAKAQREAAIARTTFAADNGEDLLLILVGPAGSRDDSEWNSLAMEIERNDLVCRKLVWLPAAKSPASLAALAEFERRTVLARPWRAGTDKSQPTLDQLATQDLGLKAWESILDRQPTDRAEVDYDTLIKDLIDAELP